MVNHPNRAMTPARRKFLEAVVANNGDLLRPARSSGWIVPGACVQERIGEACCDLGWIEAVKAPGSANTARRGMGYHYRITAAGRAALGGS